MLMGITAGSLVVLTTICLVANLFVLSIQIKRLNEMNALIAKFTNLFNHLAHYGPRVVEADLQNRIRK